jgi:hypothetical protein
MEGAIEVGYVCTYLSPNFIFHVTHFGITSRRLPAKFYIGITSRRSALLPSAHLVHLSRDLETAKCFITMATGACKGRIAPAVSISRRDGTVVKFRAWLRVPQMGMFIC